ncbi:MAG: demethoxyubiquinone hydroxylase family protein [Alphaproteobacteria bacterium]
MTAPAPSTGWRLPGDPPADALVERMIRVDHAGEYGARRIYEGQLAVLGRGPSGPAIRHMAEQEARHLAAFERMVAERRVRPTALMPIWHVAGYVLGAATAALGPSAAMACTVAIEETIDAHYRGQAEALGDAEPALKASIETFRAEELEHRDTALAAGAMDAPAYPVLTAAIKAGSRLAIWLSERI